MALPDIPARLDRLSWCALPVVVALRVTRILDGLEVTIVGAIGPMLQDQKTLAPQRLGPLIAFTIERSDLLSRCPPVGRQPRHRPSRFAG